MKDNLLKILLEGAVAIPYSDDILKLLDDSCRIYNKDDSLKVIDELAPAFITGENPRKFTLFLSKCLQNSKMNFRLPEIVISRLAMYTCLVNIDECADDDLTKYILATMIMNCMLLAKGRFNSIPHPEEIIPLYEYNISRYIKGQDRIDIRKETHLLSLMASDGNSFMNQELNKEEIEELPIIAKKATYFDIMKLLSDEDVQSYDNVYVRIYKGLSMMFDKIDYLYYDLDIYKIADILIRRGDIKRKSIHKIIDDVQPFVDETPIRSKSSILLTLLSNKESYPELDNQQLSAKEYFVYLYYELLLEKIIDNEYGREE